ARGAGAGPAPLPFGKPGPGVLPAEQKNEYELIGRLNRLAAAERPEDSALQARIRSYELAFRMQFAVPEALDVGKEKPATHRRYGLDHPATRTAGRALLAARRLVERGTRFVQVYPTPYGVWDSHQKLAANHARLCPTVDGPVAGLLEDLKDRGLWKD